MHAFQYFSVFSKISKYDEHVLLFLVIDKNVFNLNPNRFY